MIRKTLLGAALLASLPAFAQESAPDSPSTANSYSYVEVSGRLLVFDEAVGEYDNLPGVGGVLSVQFLPYAFGFAEAEGYRRSESDTELEYGIFSAGLGVAYPIAGHVDALATLAYVGRTAEACAFNRCFEIDADGFTPGAGFRFAINEKFDVLAKYEHEFIETDNPDGSTTEDDYSTAILELHGGQNGHGAVVGAEYQDGDTIFKLGYRYTFN